MSFEIRFGSTGGLVSFSGELDHNQVADARHAVFNHNNIDSVRYVIWDFSCLKSFMGCEFSALGSAYIFKALSDFNKQMVHFYVVQEGSDAENFCSLNAFTATEIGCHWKFYLVRTQDEAKSHLLSMKLLDSI